VISKRRLVTVKDLELAITAAEAGSAVIRKNFGRPTSIALKGANNPVTAVDREAESAIVELIRSHRPKDSILAEEGGSSSGNARHWIVDPLDGTVNFVHSIPHIGVSVALYEKETALVAVVTDPLRRETFTAQAGQGAHLNGQAIQTSTPGKLAETVIATGFAYDHNRYAKEYTRPLTAVLARVNGIRRFGSAALDLAWVAAGRFDGYWEIGVAPWDIAAGIMLVHESSGIVTDPFGCPATPNSSLIVAAGSSVHEELRLTIRSSLPKRLAKSR